MLVFLLFLGFWGSKIKGLPELLSNLNTLSGKICPGNVTLSCSATEFGRSGTIGFYANSTKIASHTYSSSITYPVTVLARPGFHGVHMRIADITISNRQFNFANFTLSASLSDMKRFRGYDITCGVEFLRSNPIRVGAYSIIESRDDLTLHSSSFYGEDGNLIGVYMEWSNEISVMRCGTTPITYNVSLLDDFGLVYQTSKPSTSCNPRLCSTLISKLHPRNYYLKIDAWNSSNEIEDSITRYIVGSAYDVMNYSIEINKCSLSVSCSAVIPSELCQLSYEAKSGNSDSELQVQQIQRNCKYFLDVEYIPHRNYFINVSSKFMSTNIIVILSVSKKALAGTLTINSTEVTLLVVGLLYTLSSIALFLYGLRKLKYQNGITTVTSLQVTVLLFSFAMFLAILGIWLAVFIRFGNADAPNDVCSGSPVTSLSTSLITAAHILSNFLLLLLMISTLGISQIIPEKKRMRNSANVDTQETPATENDKPSSTNSEKNTYQHINMKTNQVYGLTKTEAGH